MAHTSQDFVAFLTDLVAHQPRGQEIHVIADNLSAIRPGGLSNSSPLTPNSTSTWLRPISRLNQVENWLAKIERDVIARGIFTSVKDLAHKLVRYIRHYNRAPKPQMDLSRPSPSYRLDTISSVTGH
jgi:transposase